MEQKCLLKSMQICFRRIAIRSLSTSSNNSDASLPVKLSHRCYRQTGAQYVKHHKSPIVIMHGLMGSKSNWHSISRALSKTGRTVYSLDARNHGDSPHQETMNYNIMADDAVHFLDEVGEEKATFIGHSMGGKVFMTTALKYPERTDRLVVVDVLPRQRPKSNTIPGLLQTMLKIQSVLSEKQVDNMTMSAARALGDSILKEFEPSEGVRQFILSNLTKKDDRFKWRLNLDSLVNNNQTLASFPDLSKTQYNGPTIFIGGEMSNYISTEDLPLIQSYFPSSDLKFVDGANHWVHADKPTGFLQVLNKFLHDTDKQLHD